MIKIVSCLHTIIDADTMLALHTTSLHSTPLNSTPRHSTPLHFLAAKYGLTVSAFKLNLLSFDKLWSPVNRTVDPEVTGIDEQKEAVLPAMVAAIQGVMKEMYMRLAKKSSQGGESQSRAGRPKGSRDEVPSWFAALPQRTMDAPNGPGAPEFNWAQVRSQPEKNRKAHSAWEAFCAKGLQSGHFGDAADSCSWAKLDDKHVRTFIGCG